MKARLLYILHFQQIHIFTGWFLRGKKNGEKHAAMVTDSFSSVFFSTSSSSHSFSTSISAPIANDSSDVCSCRLTGRASEIDCDTARLLLGGWIELGLWPFVCALPAAAQSGGHCVWSARDITSCGWGWGEGSDSQWERWTYYISIYVWTRGYVTWYLVLWCQSGGKITTKTTISLLFVFRSRFSIFLSCFLLVSFLLHFFSIDFVVAVDMSFLNATTVTERTILDLSLTQNKSVISVFQRPWGVAMIWLESVAG